MPLKLKLLIVRKDRQVQTEVVAIASSGFIAKQPEIMLSKSIIEILKLQEISKPENIVKMLADGKQVAFRRYVDSVYVKVVCEDRESNEVLATVLETPSRYALLSDYLLSELGVCIIDAREGIWCFRDELGKRFRKGLP